MKYELKKWTGGRLLAFSGLDGATEFETSLVARTTFDAAGIMIMLPAECVVRFAESTEVANTVFGDWFVVGDAATRGAFADAHNLLVEGVCEIGDVPDALRVTRRGDKTLISVAGKEHPEALDVSLDDLIAVRRRVVDTWPKPSAETLPRQTERALCKALSVMKSQVCAPEGNIRHRWTTPDRWPHRQMWLWDSAFHAIGFRHFAPDVARDALSAVLDLQREDGFIPHMMSPAGHSQITQPPVLALGAMLVHEAAPAPAWLRTMYPGLCAYVAWDMRHRDTDGAGLCEWDIEGNPFCRSGESGMDNSSRFDAATSMDAPDFNAFLAHECEHLADMADLLGKTDDAAHWRAEHARLCALIRERLWSDAHGIFMDFDLAAGAHSGVMASAGFLPLLCGAATPEQAARLVAHLHDPDTFGTAFPVPSISACDTAHYAKDMWRGPVWININWLIARGLDRYGYAAEAAQLRDRTRAEIERCHDCYGTFFEYYDDRGDCDPPQLMRKGKCAPETSPYHQVLHDYGWTATLYADMIYETYGAPE